MIDELVCRGKSESPKQAGRLNYERGHMNTLNGTPVASVDTMEGFKYLKHTHSIGPRQRMLLFFSLPFLLVLCVLPVHAQKYLEIGRAHV